MGLIISLCRNWEHIRKFDDGGVRDVYLNEARDSIELLQKIRDLVNIQLNSTRPEVIRVLQLFKIENLASRYIAHPNFLKGNCQT